VIKVKSSAFTLIELLIAFVLGVTLLTGVFSLYIFIYGRHNTVKEYSEKCDEVFYSFQRLRSVFQTIVPKSSINHSKGDVYFYTSEKGMLFTYDKGPDLYPGFSGNVLGELILTEGGDLLLLTWAMEDELHPVKQELLLSGISELVFQFFYPKTEECWSDSWDKSRIHYPLFFKIICIKKETLEKVVFSFEFSSSIHGLGDPNYSYEY
jgi:hypothetical protein